MKKSGIIVEARTQSSRLKNKILLKVNNKSFLEHLIFRLKKLKAMSKINKIVIATTLNKKDEKIVKICKKNNIQFFRGSEKDVRLRVIQAAKKFKIENIIRITSDCPIIDISIVDQAIKLYENNNSEIVTNAHCRSFPDGMDVEVIKTSSLVKSLKYENGRKFKEHLSLTIKKHKSKFKIINFIAPHNLFFPYIGLTLDEKKDFILLKKIIIHFNKKNNPYFSCLDILNFLFKNRNYLKINSKVKRTTFD